MHVHDLFLRKTTEDICAGFLASFLLEESLNALIL